MQTLFNSKAQDFLQRTVTHTKQLLPVKSFFAKKPSKKKLAFVLVSYFIAWFGYFFYFWSNSFIRNTSGGVSAQHINLWGDWAAHFTMGSAMAEKSLILTTSPFLHNAPFSYPFVANMLSAILIRMNVDFFMAFILPSFVFSCLLIVALFVFYKQLSKSFVIAILASTLFLFNGGTGFVYYIDDIAASSNKLETAVNPPRDYTNIEDKHYRWISVITSMVIPQRAFTVGFPIALLILTILLQATEKKQTSRLAELIGFLTKKLKNDSFKKSLFFATAAVTGLLPIIHTHSFFAVFVILSCWSLGDLITAENAAQRKKKLLSWTAFAAIVAATAVPLITIFIASNVQDSFIKWYPGWYVGNDFPDETIFSFWFKNWTIIPILAVAGLSLGIKRSSRKVVTFFQYLPFFLLFLLTNLVLLQPFVWDNTKILVWASLGFSLLSAQLLFMLWKKSNWLKPLVVLLMFFMCFSGFLDVYRAIRFPLHSYEMYSEEDIYLAEWAKTHTHPKSLWLTGTYHNQWLFNLTGRQALATYTGWLWTHGYDYYAEEQAITHMYSQPQNSPYFEEYGIEYVVIGPFEKTQYGAVASNFPETFILVRETNNYTVLKRQ